MDANGYNNDEAYDDVDVLIMGGVVRDNIPASASLIGQLKNWISKDSTDVTTDDEKSTYNDPAYIETLKNFLYYVGDIAKDHDTQLILLYHPMNYNVDETGQLIFQDETHEWEIFQKLCEENDIVLVSTKDEYIRMYKEEHVVPNGFFNTLNSAREAAMWESGAMYDISKEKCLQLLDKFGRKDEHGKYAEFCDAIIY